MPNYNLVITAGYKPYTFDEMVKPLAMYKQEYDKYQTELDNMQTNADLAKYYIDETLDADMLATHREYMDSLNALSDAFYSGAGLTAETATRAKNLRRRFSSEIGPMLKAAQERDAEVKEQRQALLKNPNLVFTRDAQSTPLSFYQKAVRDPYTPIDLAELQKEAMTKAAAISAEYPEHTEIGSSGHEGWVKKRKYSGPSDSAEFIMNELDTNKDWDGSSEYNGKYSGYAALRNSMYAAAGLDKYGEDSPLGRRIKAAIDNGIRTGIVSKVDEELVHDPTYSKSGSGSGSGNGKNETMPSLSQLFPPQETNPIMTGVITDKDKVEISKTLQGLNELPEEAQAERGKALKEHPELLGFTTSKLDSIWKELQDHINKGKEAADKARQEASRVSLSPKTSALQQGIGTTGSMYGNIGALANNPNVSKKAQLEKIYKSYDEKYKKLKEAYFKEAQKVLNLPNLNLYKNYEEEPFDYNQLNQYREDALSGVTKTQNAETFGLDDNMKRTLTSGLKWTVGNSTSGLINARTGKAYPGLKLDNILDTSKDIDAAIENIDGKYEFVVMGKDGEKYIVRGSGYLNFAETAGKRIEFMNSITYPEGSGVTPVKLPTEYNNPENFNWMYNVLSSAYGHTLDEVGFPVQVNVNTNLQKLTTEGGTTYYGMKLRNSEGQILNVILDKNQNGEYIIKGVMNPRTSNEDRNDMVHLMASQWFSTYKGDAYKNYGQSKDYRVTSNGFNYGGDDESEQ